MKKQIITLIILALLPLAASADAVEIDGIYYNLYPKAKAAGVTWNPDKYSGVIVIPETVMQNDITYDVTNIKSKAFNNCSSLTSLSIPSSVTIIGSSAFDGCNNLNELHISSLEAWCRIRFNDTPLSYANHLYMNGEEIKELIIPNTVTSIGDFAFYGSRSLTSVTIPNNVISIGQSSFYNCSSLLSVTIPNSVTSIGDYAFSRCRSLTSITIPNSVINIGNNAFSLCNLTSITFPKSVRNIGSYAFSGCSQLASITLPESIRNIGSSAFSGCKSLKEVHISNLALYCTINFEYRPFDSALHLYLNGDEIKDLVIPNSVPFIGSYAFCYCPNLKSVNISNSVTSIGNHAFDSCISLTSVKIPNSVTYIGDYSFYNCESLITLTIGNSVERLGSGFNDSGKTFASCPELTDVYCLAEIVPTMGSNAFQDSDAEYITLHVPATSLNSYKQAESWNVFKEIVPLEVITLEKCATPTITYENGEFAFTCETEGVEFVYDVKVGGATAGTGNKVKVTPTYAVSVYATKEGYENSDVAMKEIQPTFGDLSGDGKIDAADLTKLIDILLKR